MERDKAIDHIINRMREGLPSTLKYHSPSHTLQVMETSRHIAEAENADPNGMDLLLTAAAYHDCGFLRTYNNHEEASCEIARETLPEFGYSREEISRINKMIMSTKVPQSPTNLLEKILCDADLDYLGGENYSEISETLYTELTLNGYNLDARKWLKIQIKFLGDHHYWTRYSINHRAPGKEKALKHLEKKSATLRYPPL